MNNLPLVGAMFMACLFLFSCGDNTPSDTDSNTEDQTAQDTVRQLELETIYTYQDLKSIDENEIKRVIGTVKRVGETGRGPEISVLLETEDGNEFEFYSVGMSEMDFPVDSERLVRYKVDTDSLIVGISLADEDIESATAHLTTEYQVQETVRKNMKEAEFKVEGVYAGGEQGDMGKYVWIKQGEKELNFNATFDCDVDNVARYENKKVVLYGATEKNINVLEVFGVK